MNEPLLHRVAQVLAEGRRVLILGDSFELVELLAAAPVKELVVVTTLADPDAPAGNTASGAPLRLRADWNERQNSKDLIVDAAGEAPADEVARVLKKAGSYLTARPDAPALARLPAQRLVARGGEAVILAGTATPPEPELPAFDPVEPEISPEFEPEISPDFAAERIAALEAQLAEQSQALETQLADQTRTLETAEALAKRTLELEDALAAAEQAAVRQRAASEATLATLRAELAEQAAAYEQVRTELAERRVSDRRTDSVRTRFEAARQEMSREIATLRAQVREFGEPAEDAATLVGERDEARRAYDEVVEVVEAGLRELDTHLPAPPPAFAGDGPRGVWLHAVRHVLGVAAAELGRLRHRRIELESQLEGLWIALRERDEAIAAFDDTPPPPPPASVAAPIDEALAQQVAALEAALAAERTLRSADGQIWRERVQAAEAALADRTRLVEALAGARQEAARGRLRVAAGEELQRRLSAERLLRDERITDLEVMLATHTRMQTLLGESLDEAESAREEAEADRRLLDSNLRLLQRELAALRGED